MRIKPLDLLKAKRIHRLLPVLLPTVRDLGHAQQELRWLAQHYKNNITDLRQACIKRGKYAVPLQYILQSQPFERFDVVCRPGVLIPRWETEEWTTRLARLLHNNNNNQQLEVVDFCTGTGCIPLVLSTAISNSSIYGIDISTTALDTFSNNIIKNSQHLNLAKSRNRIMPIQGDISSPPNFFVDQTGLRNADLIVANPPYITYDDYYKNTERSVRLHEPAIALLGNTEFYKYIFNLSIKLDAQAIVCEVGSLKQIEFINKLAMDHESDWSVVHAKDSADNYRVVALWRDPEWAFLKDIQQ
jgi:HemK-like putative methylase